MRIAFEQSQDISEACGIKYLNDQTIGLESPEVRAVFSKQLCQSHQDLHCSLRFAYPQKQMTYLSPQTPSTAFYSSTKPETR